MGKRNKQKHKEPPKPPPEPPAEEVKAQPGDKNFSEIISSISQIMSGQTPSTLSDTMNLTELMNKDTNLKSIFERSLITRIDDKGTSILHHGQHVPNC